MRLFIAINLPQETKDKIEKAVAKIQPLFDDFPARFLTPKNWHLTITFLGYQPDENISPILKALKETAASFEPLYIDFEKIIYGPPGKSLRMLWLTASQETSEELGEIKAKLEDLLFEGGVRFNRENRLFNAHLTLARFSSSSEKLPDYSTTRLPLSFKAKSLDLMESQLKKSGAEYESISQFDFKG